MYNPDDQWHIPWVGLVIIALLIRGRVMGAEYSKHMGIVEHLLVVSRLGWVEEWAGNRAILLQAATVTLRICHKR